LLSRFDFITADHVTIVTDILAFISAYLIAFKDSLLGLALMLMVTILDGVDGKLARLRGKPMRIGKLELSLDFLYEQVWYASLVFASQIKGFAQWTLIIGLLWLALDGYVRHIYNLGWVIAETPLKNWGKAGWIITFIDGRRNLYVWYATTSYLILKSFKPAIFLAFAHAPFTAIAYTILTIRKIGELKIKP